MQRKEIVLKKDPEIERQIVALGKQLEEQLITFEEWNDKFQVLLAAQERDMEQKGTRCLLQFTHTHTLLTPYAEKARRMFEKYDADGSGTIDPEEFRELAMRMSNEAWTDEELAKAVAEIDKGMILSLLYAIRYRFLSVI